MKRQIKFLFLLAVTVCAVMLASCFGGSLKLESLDVDTSSIKRTYIVGEELDFSGIKVYATYNDETLNRVYTYNELTFEYDENMTDAVGTYEVAVSFNDENLGGKKQTAKFTVTVNPDPNAQKPTDEKLSVLLYEQPDGILSYLKSNKIDPDTQFGDAGFLTQYLEQKKLYTVGDDNVFVYLPELVVENEDGDMQLLESFYTAVALSVMGETEYEALLAVPDATNPVIVNYYLGTEDSENLFATVNTFKGEYQFGAAALGKQVKISVIPSADKYEYDATEYEATVLEVEVIDAYNVYNVAELSLIDNTPDYDHAGDNNGAAVTWTAFKTSAGLLGVSVNGLVLHNNLKLTAQDVPDGFFYTTETDIVYTNSVTGETTTVPAGAKFLHDGSEIYVRYGSSDFVLEGNFFTIDISGFPLVPSPAVFGKDSGRDYEEDFSNSTLFVFDGQAGEIDKPQNLGKTSVSNLSLIGNAGRDAMQDADGHLVSAGGLIFNKVRDWVSAEYSNILSHSFFITYFPDYRSEVSIDKVKCYDSYQNAMMLWGESSVTLSDSFFSGSGGPLIIMQDSELDLTSTKVPSLKIENTVMDTALSGKEIWFNAVGATGVIGQIKTLGTVLEGYGLGSLTDEPQGQGNLGILAVLMTSGNDASSILQDGRAQGSVDVNGTGMNRFATDPLWSVILQHPAYGAGAPFFTVTDSEGNLHTLFLMMPNGATPYLANLDGSQFNPAAQAETYLAFQQSNMITMSMGGLTIVFDFFK